MIEIKGLTKRFGDKEVLSGLDLTVPDGSIFGLVGMNGAGKSTLLRIMAGVYKADAGSVLLDGKDVFGNERAKRKLFFLPDEPFWSTDMTGASLAGLYSSVYDFDRARFDRFAELFELDEREPLRDMSKGMRRRMFVSAAFAVRPACLLLDEAFDGLDPRTRLEFKRELVRMTEDSPCTVVISGHSLRELEDICDTYGIMDGKRITDSGSVAESVGNLHKFQLAFDRPVTREELGADCVSFESSGRVVRVVLRGDCEAFLAKAEALGPLLVDELPVDFEEYFVSRVNEDKEDRA